MSFKNDATVLAFEKKLVPSDGYLYGTTWENKNVQLALKLIQKSVRGTAAHRQKTTNEKDSLKLNMKLTDPNPQTVDACSLAETQDTLCLRFTLKVLGGVDKPSASNGAIFNESYPKVAQAYIKETNFTELARRYAINIANARYLWRNRVGSEKIEVVVKIDGVETMSFNAKEFSLYNFNADSNDLKILTEKIADALSGKLPYLLINIEAYALVGKSQEVYPSEELVLDKGKGKKSKILYAVNGTAALHSQKIGNAIRTIDTWYPEFDTANIGPIAIEPYGAVTNLGKAYRSPKDKCDFYTLFDKFALGQKLANKEEEHYIMAVLVRGGVFGQSGKD